MARRSAVQKGMHWLDRAAGASVNASLRPKPMNSTPAGRVGP
jgi:hypothetical protein